MKELRALIFDFDGLILDTESVEVVLWQELYSAHGAVFDLAAYKEIIGTFGLKKFSPSQEFRNVIGNDDIAQLYLDTMREKMDNVLLQSPPMPGVVDLISQAKTLNLRLAVGSSSPYSWVNRYLSHMGLWDEFDTVVTLDDVSHSKPSPEIFQTILSRFNIHPNQALVLEDSPNGVLAANRAGIPVIAVPNMVTTGLSFDGALEIMPSLSSIQLEKYVNNSYLT